MAKSNMTIRLIKVLTISGLIAFIYSDLHAAELTNDPLPTVQENVATHKAVLVDVREPGEWKEGHVEGAISLPLSSLKEGVDSSALEHQLPKDKIVYTHCVMLGSFRLMCSAAFGIFDFIQAISRNTPP